MKEILVYGVDGNEKSRLPFECEISEKNANEITYSCAIRKLLQNWRQGTVGCKDRGEVAFSTRKPWKQKGTGRARAGSLKSPLWRKGGVTFGPQARTKKLSINKKQTKLILNNILRDFLEGKEKKLYCLDFDLKDKPRTKVVFEILRKIKIDNKKITLFLSLDDDINMLSFKNISNVSIFYFDQPNVFDLSKDNCWMILKKDIDLFKKMVSSWN